MTGCLECLVPGVLAMPQSVMPYQTTSVLTMDLGAQVLILSCPAVSSDFDGATMRQLHDDHALRAAAAALLICSWALIGAIAIAGSSSWGICMLLLSPP